MSGGSEAPPPSLGKQSKAQEKSQVEEEGCCTWVWHILCCCVRGQRPDQQQPEEESESQGNSIAQYRNSPGEKRRKGLHIPQVSQDHEAELKSPEDSRLAFASEINVTHDFQSSRTLTAPSDQMLGESEVIEECQQWTGKDARSYQGMSSVPAVETGAHDKLGTVAAAEAATVTGARTEAEAVADSHDSEEPKPTEGEKAKPNTVMPKTLTTSKEHGTKSTASPSLGACASEIRAQSINVGLSPQASGENTLELTGYAQTAGKDNSESKVMASGRGRTKSNIDTSDHSQNDGNANISSQDPSPAAREQLGAFAGLKSGSINQQQGVLSTESAAPPQILTHSMTIPIELQVSAQDAPVLASLELTAAAHSDQVNDSDMVTPTGSPVPGASKYLFSHPSPNASLSGKEDNDSDQTPHVSGDELSETEGHGTSDSRSISCRSQEHATALSLDPTPKPTLGAASTVEDAGIGDTSGMFSQQETHIMAKLLSVRPFNALLIGDEEPQQDLELPGVLSTADEVPTEIDTAASLIAAERAAAPHPTSAKGKGESGETSKVAQETSISERTPPTVDELAAVIPVDINHALLKKRSESDLKSKSPSWPTFASSSQDRIPAQGLPGAKSSPNLIFIGKGNAANEDSSLHMSRYHSMPALHSFKSWPNVEKATRVDTAVQDNSPFPVPNSTKEQGEEVSKDCSSDTIPSAHPPDHNGNRSGDSTDLLEGGGKKSKTWLLQPSLKPVDEHSKRLNIGDCPGLLTAEELIQGEHSLTLDAASTVQDAGMGDTAGIFSQQQTYNMAKLLSVRPFNALLIGDEEPQHVHELPNVLSTADEVPTEIDTAASLIAAERAAAPRPTSAKGKGESGETSKVARETSILESTPPTVDELPAVIPVDINHALLKKRSESNLKSKSPSWPTFASSSQDRIPAQGLPATRSSPNLIFIGKGNAANEDSSLHMSRYHSMPALHSFKSWPNVEKATRVDTAVQDNSPFPVPNSTKEQGEEVSKDCSSDTIPSAHPPDHNGNRSGDSTDLLEGGGKKSKTWLLQPSPKPVAKHSKRLNIGDCLGLFTAEELIQGEHSLCERCAEVQRMHEINSQDEGEVTRVCVETAKTICYFAHLFHQFGCVIYNFPVTCSLRVYFNEIIRRLC